MRSKGYTLVELLVVVAIIGILTAIAIPNLLNSLNRSRQKRTMADLRTLAEGVEMYQQDLMFFPRYEWTTTDTLQEVVALYLQRTIVEDGWSRPFWYTSNGEHYTLLSYGSNGMPDAFAGFGATVRFEDDIVYSDGAFSRWPEGVQR